MNHKIRDLIEQLGEAIHETVAESEPIAGVVHKIRAEGFEVMLMLEATIGLDEAEPTATDGDESSEAGPFTAQDLNFLRSLRIRLTEDDGPEAAD